MAKDYKRGDDYKLFLDTASTWASPTWVQIKAATDLAIDPAKADVEIKEQDNETGHLQGNGDPMITFTLNNDEGDVNVQTLISNLLDGTITHLAVSQGDVTDNSIKYWHMECCLFAPASMTPGEADSYDVEARRHANSEYGLVKTVTA